MSKTTWHLMMSLDGFIAGPEHSMEWAFEQGGGPNAIADSVRDATGAILAGRRWHDVAMARYDGVGGIYGGAWSGPVLVLTHRPGDQPGEGVTFISTRSWCTSPPSSSATASGSTGRPEWSASTSSAPSSARRAS